MRHRTDSLEMAELAVTYRGRGCVGFDLAGEESGHPPKAHLDAFHLCQRENFSITIHAGESFGTLSIWQALQYCGAHRIGHGVRLIEDFVVYDRKVIQVGTLAQYVLDEMGIIDTGNLEMYRAGADREAGTEDDRVARSADVGGIFLAEEGGGIAGTTSSLLEVSVEVKRGASVFLLRALVSWRGARTNAAEGERAVRETTAAAQTEGDRNSDRAARGSAQTATGDAASLGYPFQIFWIAENRKGNS